MSTEQPSYKKYLEKIRSFFKKREEPQVYHDFATDQDPQKRNFNKIILGISLGFVFGALASSSILYFKIRKLQEELKSSQALTSTLRSTCMPRSACMPQFTNTAQTSMPRLILSTIDNLSSYNTFASFYESKLNEEKRQKQTVLKEQQPPPPPPLRTLIGNSLPQQVSHALIPQMPTSLPGPQMSIIICSNNKSATSQCYAISSNDKVYTNGFIQGNYKLIVTPTQAYWKKIKRK